MKNEIMLSFPDKTIFVDKEEAIATLIEWGSFDILLSFPDPRDGYPVLEYFTFYPKEQMTTQGYGFIVQHKGLLLRIPSDMDWWVRASNGGIPRIPQKTGFVRKGEYVEVEFDLKISPIPHKKG